jgi:hypothetical protein
MITPFRCSSLLALAVIAVSSTAEGRIKNGATAPQDVERLVSGRLDAAMA